MTRAGEFLDRIPEIFSPIREHAQRYLRFGAVIEEDGTVCIGRNPKVAPEYFVFRLFKPGPSEWLVSRRSYEIPIDYLRFLAAMNGCFAYGMSPKTQNDRAARIYKKLAKARGLDEAERWQHALYFAMSPQERCHFSLKTARSALSLRRFGKKKGSSRDL